MCLFWLHSVDRIYTRRVLYIIFVPMCSFFLFFFFFKQKTAYEMRISDWSSDVCSSDLVAQVRAQLGERVIRAPFAGTLGIRQVSPGALVTPGTPIDTLDDLSRMFVAFPMPETALSRIAAGQQVSARVSAWPGSAFDGVMEPVDARVEPGPRPAPLGAARQLDEVRGGAR